MFSVKEETSTLVCGRIRDGQSLLSNVPPQRGEFSGPGSQQLREGEGTVTGSPVQ